MGKLKESDDVMEKAFALEGAGLLPVHIYATRLLGEDRKEKALSVFKLNQQRHPEEKFWTYLGLARAYTALGEKDNAIKNWEIAIQNVPPSRKGQLPAYETALRKLKEGK